MPFAILPVIGKSLLGSLLGSIFGKKKPKAEELWIWPKRDVADLDKLDWYLGRQRLTELAGVSSQDGGKTWYAGRQGSTGIGDMWARILPVVVVPRGDYPPAAQVTPALVAQRLGAQSFNVAEVIAGRVILLTPAAAALWVRWQAAKALPKPSAPTGSNYRLWLRTRPKHPLDEFGSPPLPGTWYPFFTPAQRYAFDTALGVDSMVKKSRAIRFGYPGAASRADQVMMAAQLAYLGVGAPESYPVLVELASLLNTPDMGISPARLAQEQATTSATQAQRDQETAVVNAVRQELGLPPATTDREAAERSAITDREAAERSAITDREAAERSAITDREAAERSAITDSVNTLAQAGTDTSACKGDAACLAAQDRRLAALSPGTGVTGAQGVPTTDLTGAAGARATEEAGVAASSAARAYAAPLEAPPSSSSGLLLGGLALLALVAAGGEEKK